MPSKYKIDGNGYTASVLVIFSIWFGAEAIVSILVWSLDRIDEAPTAQDWVFGPIGICFLALGLNQLFVRGQLIVDSKKIRCNYFSLFGGDTWEALLNSYKYLETRRETRLTGANGQIIYTIWLVHEDRKKSLKLNSSSSAEYEMEDLERLSKLLNNGLKAYHKQKTIVPKPVAISFFLIGFTLLAFAISDAISAHKLAASGTQANAVVVALEKSGYSQFPTFKFTDQQNRIFEIRSNYSSKDYYVGDFIPIIYPTDSPIDARINDPYALYSLSIFLGILGTVILVGLYGVTKVIAYFETNSEKRNRKK